MKRKLIKGREGKFDMESEISSGNRYRFFSSAFLFSKRSNFAGRKKRFSR